MNVNGCLWSDCSDSTWLRNECEWMRMMMQLFMQCMTEEWMLMMRKFIQCITEEWMWVDAVGATVHTMHDWRMNVSGCCWCDCWYNALLKNECEWMLVMRKFIQCMTEEWMWMDVGDETVHTMHDWEMNVNWMLMMWPLIGTMHDWGINVNGCWWCDCWFNA